MDKHRKVYLECQSVYPLIYQREEAERWLEKIHPNLINKDDLVDLLTEFANHILGD